LQSQLDCHDKASALIQTALRLAPNDNKLLDSQLQIQAALTKASLTQSQCALDTVDLR
jgi:hypothetical protein